MNTLIVVNDGPYGNERSYNALRLGRSLAGREGVLVSVFFIGDGAACAKRGQKVPTGYYNVETMLASISKLGGRMGVCGTCMDARGLGDQDLVEGARRSTMDELTSWTVEADKVLTF